MIQVWSNFENSSKLEIPTKWEKVLGNIDLSNIENQIIGESKTNEIYPPKHLVFNAFEITTPESLKVVILGQDPYIKKNQAMGLAFSVPENTKIPPSLRNIKKKITNSICETGDLTLWAKQGVLLLNTSLTVNANKSNSHKKIWKYVIDEIIEKISDRYNGLVFLLWGAEALAKINLIDTSKHHILISSHPSPLGCNKKMKEYESFNECDHFNQCNTFLTQKIHF